MVVACLDDCEHKKGTVQKMMEARVLPVLVLELRKELSVELRIAFQALFDLILMIAGRGTIVLSKHFPTLLALSQDKDSHIAEPVIETIGCAPLLLFTILFLSSSLFSLPSLLSLSSISPTHSLSPLPTIKMTSSAVSQACGETRSPLPLSAPDNQDDE
ncbi:hypothetical protein BLNAU_1241 [Blattamonas nauphoetae]|uniref:Uncharacterized protein n=1 Tax=Blattamonas nauphoetae TaxID=2049346 RepID=A0ABQ9YIU2_9EUKA|nr:hypothetical protein BLNAU_1241 [Blattamonas nauphoetae]